MAEAEEKPVVDETKKKGFFDKLHPRVMYSAFAFPGLGQWQDGSKVRGGILMGLVFIIAIIAFGAYAVGAVKFQECPMDLYEISDLVPCMKWISHEAWLFSKARVWQCVAAFGVVYVVSLGEALYVRRGEITR